jgi:hypothetical protein
VVSAGLSVLLNCWLVCVPHNSIKPCICHSIKKVRRLAFLSEDLRSRLSQETASHLNPLYSDNHAKVTQHLVLHSYSVHTKLWGTAATLQRPDWQGRRPLNKYS